MTEVLPIVGQVIIKCADWFFEILNKLEALKVWSTAVMVVLSYKFLLRPLFGYAGSDIARKSYNAFKRRKEN